MLRWEILNLFPTELDIKAFASNCNVFACVHLWHWLLLGGVKKHVFNPDGKKGYKIRTLPNSQQGQWWVDSGFTCRMCRWGIIPRSRSNSKEAISKSPTPWWLRTPWKLHLGIPCSVHLPLNVYATIAKSPCSCGRRQKAVRPGIPEEGTVSPLGPEY